MTARLNKNFLLWANTLLTIGAILLIMIVGYAEALGSTAAFAFVMLVWMLFYNHHYIKRQKLSFTQCVFLTHTCIWVSLLAFMPFWYNKNTPQDIVILIMAFVITIIFFVLTFMRLGDMHIRPYGY